jgi:(E)-4-hydroxy-3-methylbut-2-enyl-diphosphate synthase
MVNGVKIGGGAPVSVQSMTNTHTHDIDATVDQIIRLQDAGCELVRVAVPDAEAAAGLGKIKERICIPLIADVHFEYKLALSSIEQGADCLRLNPGNIGAKWKVEEVTKAAQDKGVPIRIGVNGGSVTKKLIKKHGGPTAGAMAESALEHIHILEDLNFNEIKVSMKASNVRTTVDAYRKLADSVDYPFHIGISEAGTRWSGTIKSAVGVGILLNEGMGDTLRISLTDDPVEEVRVAYEILKVLGIRQVTPELVSCPTCGRCEINLIEMANEVEQALAKIKKPIKVAVMGCVVNGPGEAREADIGIAGGKSEGLIFRKGKILRKVPEDQLKDALLEEAMKL